MKKQTKWILLSILIVVSIVVFFALPILIAFVLNSGKFACFSLGVGYDAWFGFWGSYTGSIVAVILAVYNWRITKKLSRSESRPHISKIQATIDKVPPEDIPQSIKNIYCYNPAFQYKQNHMRLTIGFDFFGMHTFHSYEIQNITINEKYNLTCGAKNVHKTNVTGKLNIFFKYSSLNEDKIRECFDHCKNSGKQFYVTLDIKGIVDSDNSYNIQLGMEFDYSENNTQPFEEHYKMVDYTIIYKD